VIDPACSFGRVAAQYELGRDALIARIASWNPVAALPDAEHEAFLAGIAKHLTEPTYNTMLDTHLYWTRLVSS
jgi:hypothetical protein